MRPRRRSHSTRTLVGGKMKQSLYPFRLARTSLLALVGALSLSACGGAAPIDDSAAERRFEADYGQSSGGPSINTGIAFDTATGVVTVTGNDDVDAVTVTAASGNITVTRNSFSSTYAASSVTEIIFYAYGGNDVFLNTTSVKSTVYGGSGDDDLTGGSGDDFIDGGAGQDIIHGGDGADILKGNSGNDIIYGGNGADVIYGGDGDDELRGEGGADRIYGGFGTNQLFGGLGQDVLVSIGGGIDTVTGGAGLDYIWTDATDVLADASQDEIDLGYVHQVAAFRNVSYSGSSGPWTLISEELDAPNLPDPLPLPGASTTKQSFASSPLFASGSPSKDDIFQGGVGDCYLLAVLSAVADAKPEVIRKLVVDLGDGTYAVRFYKNGVAKYVRVDAELWVDSTGRPEYANSSTNASIWVPIVEKAYAFFRRDEGSYDSIVAGDGTLEEDMNAVKSAFEITDTHDDADIRAWYNNGAHAGTVENDVHNGVVNLLNWIDAQKALGAALYTGSVPAIDDTSAIDDTTWRRGQHVYMIDQVERNSSGTPTGLILRDPHGVPRRIHDFIRIYYCIGRAYRWDMQ
ncbi:Alkaline phosphatase [Minicystis rosea]|nr:Alkaline phosphatase [Minicystis rosea]